MNIAPDAMVANPETGMSDNGESKNTSENGLPSQEQLKSIVQLLLDELKKWNAEQLLRHSDPLVELNARIAGLYEWFAQEKPASPETQWLRKVVSTVDFLQTEPLIKARLAPSIDKLLRSRLTGVPEDRLQGGVHLPENQQNLVVEMKVFAEAMKVEIPNAIGQLENLLTELEDHSPAKTEEMV